MFCLNQAKCNWSAYSQADATATMPPQHLFLVKIQNGLPGWCWFTRLVLERNYRDLFNNCIIETIRCNSKFTAKSNSWKKFLNQSLFGKVTGTSSVASTFWTSSGQWPIFMLLCNLNIITKILFSIFMSITDFTKDHTVIRPISLYNYLQCDHLP